MKKFSLFALAALGLMLGACSDKDEVENNVSETTPTADEGYIAIGINLPTSPAPTITRATNDNGYSNFDLNDGLNSEYIVNDATMLIFNKNTNEDDATFKAFYSISPAPWGSNEDPHVTESSRKIVQKVGSGIAVGDLVLIVLNKNNLLTVDGTTLKAAGTNLEPGTTTFATYKELLATSTAVDNANAMTQSGFYMTNSPLFTKKGSTASDNPAGTQFRTLVPVPKVFETKEAADAAEGADNVATIFVERGMAKVTFDQAITTERMEGATSGDYYLKASISAWTLDQTNKKSFLVRSTTDVATFAPLKNAGSGIYRFTGNTEINENNWPGLYKYRGYFAIDPNYYSTSSTSNYKVNAGELSKIGDASDFVNTFGNENPQYCFENTFNVENQIRMHTTLAQVKVTTVLEKRATQADVDAGKADAVDDLMTQPAADLYTVNGVNSSVYTADGLNTFVKAAALTVAKAKGKMKTDADLSSVSSDDLFDAITFAPIDASISYELKVSSITHNSTNSTYFAGDSFTADADFLTALNAQLGTITKYTGGVSYYAIRIKHFGDDLTPWNASEKVTTTNTAANGYYTPVLGKIYGIGETPDNSDNNYLGRYGVLRNNWYDLKVNKINVLGSPVPLDYSNDTTTDDELDGYIDVQIHVLSWAKRTQAWDL